MLNALLATILIIILLVLGWHIIFPLMGGVIAVSAMAWLFIVASVVIFAIVTLLVFALGGFWIFGIGLIFAIWTIVAIVLFPILFPILLPLFIIFAFVSIFRRKNKIKQLKD